MKSTIVKFTAKPEHRDSFAKTLKEAQEATKKEDGNIEIRVFVSKDDENIFFVYERWADRAAITSHDNEPHTKKLMEVGKTALKTKPDFYFLGDTHPLPDHSKSANPEDEVFIIFFIFKLKSEYREQLIQQFEDHITHTRKEEKGNRNKKSVGRFGNPNNHNVFSKVSSPDPYQFCLCHSHCHLSHE